MGCGVLTFSEVNRYNLEKVIYHFLFSVKGHVRITVVRDLPAEQNLLPNRPKNVNKNPLYDIF